MNLPEEVYSEVITSFKDYANISLKEVKKVIKQFHCRLKRSDKINESKEESVMQLNNHNNKNKSSKWNKQFKGKCYNCEEPGQRASECPKPKKKHNFRKLRRNIKYFNCGENHYANKCPQKKSKSEQAYMFVGITDIIRENDMKEKIKIMTEIDKLKLVNMILKNISANQLFEPERDEAINPQVSMIANSLLNDWLDQDNDILEIKYENYMKKKENSNEKSKKIKDENNLEVEDNS